MCQIFRGFFICLKVSIFHVGLIFLEGDVLVEFWGAFVALNLKFQQASNLQIPITSIHLSDIVA